MQDGLPNFIQADMTFLEPTNIECERPLSPTFDLKFPLMKPADATAINSFEESSRKLKIKKEPEAGHPSHTYNTENSLTKTRPLDIATTSTAVSSSNTSSDTTAENKEPKSVVSTRESEGKSTVSSPTERTPPMPQLHTESAITQAAITSHNSTEQAQPLIPSQTNLPRYMHNSHKHSWSQRQKEVKKILKQRTQEWKEKQSLYQLMRSAASQNPLLGHHKRGKDQILYGGGRGEVHHGSDVIPRSAFSWYPRFVPPTDLTHLRSYPVASFPIMSEYDPKIGTSQAPFLKRRHSNDVCSSDVVQNIGRARVDSHNEPMIKDVVSLARASSPNDDGETSVEHRRSKRARKTIDEPAPLERRESIDSGNGEIDGDNLTSGKYISDFAETFQNTPEDHQVAHINGLLSLPSSRETRYGITYGELKRRCGAPEYLTRVDLVAYVRHSKSSGRSLLDKYKIVSANRASRPTIMSKMCENEARVLGDGIFRMNMNYFPDKVLAGAAAEKLKESLKDGEEEENKKEKVKSRIKEKMENIETTRSMLKEVFDLLQSEKDNEQMQRFELASHTFGTVNLKNHLSLFDRFFQEYQTSLMASIESPESDA